MLEPLANPAEKHLRCEFFPRWQLEAGPRRRQFRHPPGRLPWSGRARVHFRHQRSSFIVRSIWNPVEPVRKPDEAKRLEMSVAESSAAGAAGPAPMQGANWFRQLIMSLTEIMKPEAIGPAGAFCAARTRPTSTRIRRASMSDSTCHCVDRRRPWWRSAWRWLDLLAINGGDRIADFESCSGSRRLRIDTSDGAIGSAFCTHRDARVPELVVDDEPGLLKKSDALLDHGSRDGANPGTRRGCALRIHEFRYDLRVGWCPAAKANTIAARKLGRYTWEYEPR